MKTLSLTRGMAPLSCCIVALVTAMGTGGCSIDETINVSPNGINEQSIKTRDGMLGVLVALQSVTGDFYSGDRSRVNSIWTWQMAGTGIGRVQPVAWNDYQMTEDGPTNENWLNAYRGVKLANDIITIAPGINFGGDKARNTVLGIAKAYKALLLGEVAAMYGSAPIAIQGLAPSPFATQSEVYADAQRLLDEALGHFANSAPVNEDLNFQGDAAKWTGVVHSLKARYFLHTKQYSEALAQANLGIADGSGTLFAIYTDAAIEFSPWGHFTLSEGEPIKVEKSFMDSLKSDSGDTRIAEYFTPNDSGNYVGFAAHDQANASDEEKDPTRTASLKKYAGFGDEFPLISFEETVLIKAEAEARAGSLANAVTLVNMIRSDAGLADFQSGDQAAVIAQVLKQKYLELFLEGQDYNDQRRTGTLREARVPKRWIYPESEKNANQNTPADNEALVSTLVGP